MTSIAAQQARHVLSHLGSPDAELTRIVGRRPGREVFRATDASRHRPLYLKVFGRRCCFEREANAYGAIEPATTVPLIASFPREHCVVTEEAHGVAAPDMAREQQPRALLQAVAAFERLLSTRIQAPVDPIAYPADPKYGPYLRLIANGIPGASEWISREMWEAQPLMPSHGDLTPHNVFASPSAVSLIDFEFFGIGQPLHDAASLCLSPSLAIATSDRVKALLACARAVSRVSGQHVAIENVACAAGIWAVRLSAYLHQAPPALDEALLPGEPLRIAGEVLAILTRAGNNPTPASPLH